MSHQTHLATYPFPTVFPYLTPSFVLWSWIFSSPLSPKIQPIFPSTNRNIFSKQIHSNPTQKRKQKLVLFSKTTFLCLISTHTQTQELQRAEIHWFLMRTQVKINMDMGSTFSPRGNQGQCRPVFQRHQGDWCSSRDGWTASIPSQASSPQGVLATCLSSHSAP